MYKTTFRYKNIPVNLTMTEDRLEYRFKHKSKQYGNALGIGNAKHWTDVYLDEMKQNARDTIDHVKQLDEAYV